MNTAQRFRIYRENKTIAENGGYQTAAGFTAVPEPGTTLYFPAKQPVTVPEIQRSTPWEIDANTRAADTVSCILALRSEGVTGEIIALNFANAMMAGGGYRIGGNAQEESLCRSSLLYDAIRQEHAFYRRHRLLPTPLYSDGMLLTPDTPVFRSADGNLLDEPTRCTFLTCAAVNRRFAKLLLISERRIEKVMQRRIRRIAALIAQRNPQAAVLGAFGCGAFGNRREVVFPLIAQAVNTLIPESVQVVMACPDADPQKGAPDGTE